MTPGWVDVCIVSTVDAGELLGLLDDPAAQGAWQDEQAIHLYWPAQIWSPDLLASVKRAVRQLDSDGSSMPQILVQRVPHEDWNRQWAQSVKPLYVGRRIVIRPSWEQINVVPGQVEIVLDPKQAFGTGHHPTTRMLLEWMEDVVCGGESVLDVGTGSGLLAMVALRLGAARAVGIDNDPVAIECALEYAALNRFGSELSFWTASLTKEPPFDLVLANLDRRTLLELADRLAGATGGRLLISGLLTEQRQEIVETFARADLYPRRQREREGWLAMEFSRAQSCEDA